MATGALVLTVSAIFATKANKKFATILTAKATSGSNTYVIKNGSAFLMTTAIVNGGQLQLSVNGITHVAGDLVTADEGNSGVYFK